MIPEGNRKSNINRFSGFEDTYDRYRPAAPPAVIEILTNYLGRKPSVVVDVGCGTGLSSFIWKEHAERIIGVEPNADMRGKALEKLSRQQHASHFSFIAGYSNQLELKSGTADLITCSQSFHWMEPVSTLQEAARVLRENGIFAAYDCDWPPSASWSVEDSYMKLLAQADAVIAQLAPKDSIAHKRDKNEHLRHIAASGAFRFTKELVFHHTEACDAERYVGLALSQGGVQTAKKLASTVLDADIAAFKEQVEQYFGGRTLDVRFGYRMRLGVK